MVKLLFAILLAQSVVAGQVFTSEHGKKYHTHKDCQYIRNSSSVKTTTLQQAQKDGKTLCSRCEAKDKKEGQKK